jgi:hypothetical protein
MVVKCKLSGYRSLQRKVTLYKPDPLARDIYHLTNLLVYFYIASYISRSRLNRAKQGKEGGQG